MGQEDPRTEHIIEIDGLRLNLKEVEETLLAIRSGEVDAMVVRCNEGERVRAFHGAEHPFRTLVDAMNEGAVLLDAEGTILYSNRRFAEMLGKAADDLVGLRIFTLLPPGPSGAAELGETRRREISLQRADGQLLEVRITLSRFRVDGVSLMCLVMTDLADERRAERIAAAERRASFLARAGSVLEESVDFEATVESVARISAPALGDRCWVHLSEDEGGPARQLAMSHGDPATVELSTRPGREHRATPRNAPILQDVLRSGQAVLHHNRGPEFYERFVGDPEFEKAIRQFRPVSLMVVPLVARGHVLGTLSFAREEGGRSFDPEDLRFAQELASLSALAIDNARLHRLALQTNEDLERRVGERTAELEASVRELEAFTYTVAHDLRAPLRAIAGCCDLLFQEFGDPLREHTQARDYYDRIIGGAKKMDALISDLLSFSHLGRVDLKLEVVSLEAALSEARAFLHDELSRSGGRLYIGMPLPSVRAHRTTLVQVLANLISNALKFVAPGVRPEVRIAAERGGGKVRLRVLDNGIGIDAIFRDRIFGVFERLNQSERYPGTGIGLAIVRRGVERMGGRCGLESEVGKGSCFWIELLGEPEGP